MTETTPTKVHKLTVLVVNHDDLDDEALKANLESANFGNDCMLPQLMDIETKEVEWHDDHALNNTNTAKYVFADMFRHNIKSELIEHLSRGTVFLQMQGERSRIGLIREREPDDRVSGTSFWIYEDGRKENYNPHAGDSDIHVLPLGRIKVGNNPLRDLILWRQKFGG